MFPAPRPALHEIARRLNRSDHWVNTRLGLLDLPNDLQEPLHDETLSMSHALALATVDDVTHRAYLLHFVKNSGVSLAVLREWVAAFHAARAQNPTAEPPRPTLPLAGQTVTVQMPCYLCHESFDHTTLLITRICAECHEKVNGPT